MDRVYQTCDSFMPTSRVFSRNWVTGTGVVALQDNVELRRKEAAAIKQQNKGAVALMQERTAKEKQQWRL